MTAKGRVLNGRGKAKMRRRFPNQDLLRVMILSFFFPSFLLALNTDAFLPSPDHLYLAI